MKTPSRTRRVEGTPAPRAGFTLVELLVVVAIVALLVMLLAPSLSLAKSVTRSVLCVNNLKQVDSAFQAWVGRSMSSSANFALRYPLSGSWPNYPMDIVPDKGIYSCPEDVLAATGGGSSGTSGSSGSGSAGGTGTGSSTGSSSSSSSSSEVVYEVRTTYNNADVPSHMIPFANGPLCKVVDHGAQGYDEYDFDDGVYRDYDDAVFYVTRGKPRVSTWISGIGRGKGAVYSGDANNTMALYRNGVVVPGWEDFRKLTAPPVLNYDPAQVLKDAQAAAASGGGAGGGGAAGTSGSLFFDTVSTNYGFNTKLDNQSDIAPGMVVLLDYTQETVNPDTDKLSDKLPAGARHRKKINVLFADHAVRTLSYSMLDPAVNPSAMEMWNGK
jgi:prepilin-type N-terminal cleavage/methylation domain-containing protein